jgi:hypothetical protein
LNKTLSSLLLDADIQFIALRDSKGCPPDYKQLAMIPTGFYEGHRMGDSKGDAWLEPEGQ